MKVYTIGHSNRSLEEFIELLKTHSVRAVADVRRFPTSKFEHFKAENLARHLAAEGIEYRHFPSLGGYRRRVLDESPNVAIKSEGFRNYADFMLTDEFKFEVEKLVELISSKTTALMCAERLFWRCHRKFLADYLTLRGFTVLHIIDSRRVVEHRMSREARVVGGLLVYDRVEG